MFGCLLIGLYLFPIKPLVNGATRRLGDISYSVYLVHSPIIVLLFPVYRHLQRSNLSQIEVYGVALGVTLLCVISASILTFNLWENWTNEWGKRFASRCAGRKNVEIHDVKRTEAVAA